MSYPSYAGIHPVAACTYKGRLIEAQIAVDQALAKADFYRRQGVDVSDVAALASMLPAELRQETLERASFFRRQGTQVTDEGALREAVVEYLVDLKVGNA